MFMKKLSKVSVQAELGNYTVDAIIDVKAVNNGIGRYEFWGATYESYEAGYEVTRIHQIRIYDDKGAVTDPVLFDELVADFLETDLQDQLSAYDVNDDEFPEFPH